MRAALDMYATSLPLVYRHLERIGLINFGVPGRLTLRFPASPHVERPSVVVIGAGISGLCAAQQLRRWGHREFPAQTGHGAHSKFTVSPSGQTHSYSCSVSQQLVVQ